MQSENPNRFRSAFSREPLADQQTGAESLLPGPAWARIMVLFVTLAAIKLALLFQLRKQVFEIHFRVDTVEEKWWNTVAFGLFLCLGVASLLQLGRQCRSVGVRAVRTANAVVLALGLTFIFLTFHEGDKNYVYPILTGVLNWRSLGPYLSLDFFFRAPYLGAWLFGYALTYYMLARTGREGWVLHLTAVLAGIYGTLYLRELIASGDELLIADCLGLTAVIAARHSGRTFALGLALLPFAWAALLTAEFLQLATTARSGPSYIYFSGLLLASIVLFGGATVLAKRRGYLASWSIQLSFYYASFLLLGNINYPVAPNFSHTLCLGFKFPHYFCGEFLVSIGLAVCAVLWHRVRPKAGFWWLDVASLGAIAVALMDLRLTQIMGVRLEWNVLAMGNKVKMMWRMARPYLPGVVLGLALAVTAYVLILRLIQRWQRRPFWITPPLALPNSFRQVAASFLLLALLGLITVDQDKALGQAGLRLAATSPLWKRMTNRVLGRDEFLKSARTLGLGDLSLPVPSPARKTRRDLNVVLVFMESTFNEHLSLFGSSEETEPLLSKYKKHMELFPNFFSDFASSIHARFAAFTSLYPVKDFNAFTVEHVGVKSVFEVLHSNGYSCSLFYSSYFDYTGFRDFLNHRGLEEMYDADSMPGQRKTERVAWGLREEETLGAIRGQIQKYAGDERRFFLTYVPAAPHYPYEKVPVAFHKHSAGKLGDQTPFYLNELLYMDWVIASILDQLKESGLLDRTLVVIADDHGEWLGANGGPIGHGWLLTPALVNAPLIILDPDNPGYHLNYTFGSQIDLLPTLLDRLGISLPSDQLYEGCSLDSPDRPSNRVDYLNTFQQYGILSGKQIMLGDRVKDQTGSGHPERKIYPISNQGSKTLFGPEGTAPELNASIRDFDTFQEGLLRNYSAYCQAVRRGTAEHGGPMAER